MPVEPWAFLVVQGLVAAERAELERFIPQIKEADAYSLFRGSTILAINFAIA